MKSHATSVAAYLKALDPERREALSELRKLVKKLVPKARETMSYGMPTYEFDSPVCALASQKQYLALYVCETGALDLHREDFAHLNVGKSCIRFRDLDELPMESVRAVLREAAKQARRAT